LEDVEPPDSVPEPGSLTTFGIGLAVLGVLAHRHRRAQAGAEVKPSKLGLAGGSAQCHLVF
jgi:hypothetical protein